jgi:hypothetical protein
MTRRTGWTDEDVAKLRSMARKHPPEEIAKELGRGVSAVRVKAHKLRMSLSMRATRASPEDAGGRHVP